MLSSILLQFPQLNMHLAIDYGGYLCLNIVFVHYLQCGCMLPREVEPVFC